MDQEDRIRERAHRIWEEEGRPEGRHQEHWERACREMGTTQTSKSNTAPGGSQGQARPQAPARSPSSARQSASNGGLVGADDADTGVPDAMGVDDLNVTGGLSGPEDSRPTTGRSKLVGT